MLGKLVKHCLSRRGRSSSEPTVFVRSKYESAKVLSYQVGLAGEGGIRGPFIDEMRRCINTRGYGNRWI